MTLMMLSCLPALNAIECIKIPVAEERELRWSSPTWRSNKKSDSFLPGLPSASDRASVESGGKRGVSLEIDSDVNVSALSLFVPTNATEKKIFVKGVFAPREDVKTHGCQIDVGSKISYMFFDSDTRKRVLLLDDSVLTCKGFLELQFGYNPNFHSAKKRTTPLCFELCGKSVMKFNSKSVIDETLATETESALIQLILRVKNGDIPCFKFGKMMQSNLLEVNLIMDEAPAAGKYVLISFDSSKDSAKNLSSLTLNGKKCALNAKTVLSNKEIILKAETASDAKDTGSSNDLIMEVIEPKKK